ncbi:MAG: hypothetical protein E4G90_07585, partial [Gemmatimonadales bacterium]
MSLNRAITFALVAVTFIAGCATTQDRPVEDCASMAEDELRRPIHVEHFHFTDFTGVIPHRVRVSVEVGLD